MNKSNKGPSLSWYMAGVRDWEANMSVFYLSNIYSGYLTEPSYETVEKHDLRFICTGDIDTLKELLNR